MVASTVAAVEVPGAPAIDGPRFRRFVDDGDLEHMLQITNRCWDADGVGHPQNLALVANSHRRTGGFDPRSDLLFAEVHGRPVAYSRVKNARQADGIRLYGPSREHAPHLGAVP